MKGLVVTLIQSSSNSTKIFALLGTNNVLCGVGVEKVSPLAVEWGCFSWHPGDWVLGPSVCLSIRLHALLW